MLQQVANKRIFIFDPCFGDMTGHWENYCKRLYQELIERGNTVVVYGQATYQSQIVGNVNFKPLFTHSPFVPTRNFFELNYQAAFFMDDLMKLDRNEFKEGDIFIFHSLYTQIFAAIIDWTNDISKTVNITSCIFLQFPPSDTKRTVNPIKRLLYGLRRRLNGEKPSVSKLEWVDNTHVRFYQKKIPMMKKLIAERHLLLVASTDVLSRNYSALFGIKVHYLPMPGRKLSSEQRAEPINIENAEKASQIVKVGYFGHSSLEKGGQFLQYIVEKIMKSHPEVHFVLHLNPNADVEKSFACFKTHAYPNISCYHGHLDQEEMMKLVGSVDIVLMPYSIKKYATMPSAIFTEGLPLKKIFIIPKNTWVYEEAKKYDVGFVAFSRFTEGSVLKALLKAIVNFDKLKSKSVIGGESFYRENNMTNYIDVFMRVLDDFRVKERVLQ